MSNDLVKVGTPVVLGTPSFSYHTTLGTEVSQQKTA